MKRVSTFFRQRRWLVLFILILGAGLYFYFSRKEPEEAIILTTPQYRDITESLEITGSISAREIANLTFSAPGRLSWVGVTEGDTVKQWQTIASLDTRTIQKQLQQDLNLFAKEFRDHDQTLDDYDYYNTPSYESEVRRILEKAQYDLDNSVLQVEIRDLAIKLSSLYSPIDGTVTKVDKPFAGATVGVTDVYQVINFDTLYFQAYVDEEDVPAIDTSFPTVVELDAFSDDPLNSSIAAISLTPTSTETGTGYEVTIPIPTSAPYANKLRIGMNGTAQIIIDQKQHVLTIESQSLIFRDGQLYVDVQTPEGISQVPVEIGLETETYVEILSGIDEDSQVVLPSQG